MLAKLLHERGMDIRVVIFQPKISSSDSLRDSGISIVSLRPWNVLHLVWIMRREVIRGQANVVIAFLKWSSLVVELAGLPQRDFRIIVSERSLDLSGRAVVRWMRYCSHFLADVVVCNAFAQRDRMNRFVPRLKERVHVIVNGVDLDHFRPEDAHIVPSSSPLRVLVLAKFVSQKNPFGLLEAMSLLRTQHPELGVVVDWYGDVPDMNQRVGKRLRAHSRGALEASSTFRKLQSEIVIRSLHECFRLHSARTDVLRLYRAADVACLPSFYEGSSNFIGEALACGIPVLASRVSDNGRLVKEGITGFLFDPYSPEEIANTIVRFAELPELAVRAMGRRGREMAESQLAPSAMGDSFASLISQVLA